MPKKQIFIFVTVFIIIIIIAIPTIITINNRHNQKLLTVVESKIKETAKSCYDQGKCLETKITLKELYNKNLLKKTAHPLTKEYYNEESYVLISENTIQFIEIKK